ncbi:hypothetical protein Pint_16639 [Pistacia integerrima]|uniref:Uncharacterized protein n=1 Tax=Pistacia integerrima TaxID=434235 RepID=A0ACC0Z9W5_9ROSI|nr:hypothetical protein Pint_16639 [Pistacia integerrima]
MTVSNAVAIAVVPCSSSPCACLCSRSKISGNFETSEAKVSGFGFGLERTSSSSSSSSRIFIEILVVFLREGLVLSVRTGDRTRLTLASLKTPPHLLLQLPPLIFPSLVSSVFGLELTLLIGVPDKAEKDEIVKAVMNLKRAEVEEGYTMDAVVARQDLLMDVRDKLLFEPEYAGNKKEKIPPKCPPKNPMGLVAWCTLPPSRVFVSGDGYDGLPISLVQVGEEKIVLDLGRSALQHPNAKPYVHDFLLSMALAECAIAKTGFEKNKVSQGFEALARAQCLLRSNISLGKMPLLSQIEESLEELAPACTLELLGMPHSPENAERRRGAIAALRELLRQGLDVETSCQVQDWPCFLSQALNRLMATEIVDLLPWDNLAITRKNKKSIESQNQKVVIDFDCFYMALIAHLALGFSSKQIEWINKAKTICECLIASEGIDLKFEGAFCMFLLGQVYFSFSSVFFHLNVTSSRYFSLFLRFLHQLALQILVFAFRLLKAEAFEKLRQLELNSNPAVRSALSGKEIREVSGPIPSLEKWLKDNVLAIFSDTQDCSPSLVNFFRGEKKNPVSKKSRVAPQASPTISQRPLANSLLSNWRDFDDSLPYVNSSSHLGSAVKQLAATDLQSPLLSAKNGSGSNVGAPSVQFKRDLGVHHTKVWESWLAGKNVIGGITYATVMGCFMFLTFKLSGMGSNRMINASKLNSTQQNMGTSSLVWKKDSSRNSNLERSRIKGSGIADRLKELVEMVKMQFRNKSDTGYLQSVCLPASLSTSMTAVNRRQMPLEEAEALVRQWQTVKAGSFGA